MTFPWLRPLGGLLAFFVGFGLIEAGSASARTLQCAPYQKIYVRDVLYTADGSGVLANVPNNDVLALIQGGCGFPGGGGGGSSAGVSGDIQTSDGAGGFVALRPGTGIATWLRTPNSANLAAALTDETGTGAAVFANSPTLVTPNLGTPSALTLTNATGLPISGIAGLGTGVATHLATPAASIPSSWLQAGVAVANLGFTPPPNTRSIASGTGLTGGGDLSADRTLSLAAIAANSVLMNATGSSAAPSAVEIPACADTGGQHLNYASGVFSCGTSGSGGGSQAVSDGTTTVSAVTTETFGTGFKVTDLTGGTAKVDLVVVPNNQTGATYTIVASDANKSVNMTNASPTTVTVTASATLGAAFGTYLYCDAGCTIQRSGSDTINGATSMTLAAKQGAYISADGGTAIRVGVLPASDPSNGANLQAGTVTNAKLASMAPSTLKGNNTGGSAAPLDLTATQVAAMLPTMVGDSGSGGTKGSVPAPAAGDAAANKFLKANGTWATPPSGGTGCNTTGASGQLVKDDGAGGCTSIAQLTDDGSIFTNAHAFALSGTLTPTALSGNVNDYNPTNLATASTLRIDGGAADRTITGIAGGTDGRILTIVNIGSTNALILSNADAASSAANRFQMDSGVTLPPNAALTLRYDGTASRWRSLGRTHQAVDYVVGWAGGVNPNKFIAFTAPRAMVVTGIVGTVADAVGAAATITVRKAPSGTVCSSGTALHTGSFDANGTAATNQTLTLSATASDLQLAAGDRVCLSTTQTTEWTSGAGNGAITITARAM